MERELDIKLFSRDNRALRLTPAGKILLEEFEKVFLQYNNALALAKNANNKLSGRIRVGLLDGIEVTSVLTKALHRMNDLYPDVDVSLFSFCYEELSERLYDGRLDIVFTQQFEAEGRSDIEYEVVQQTYDCVAMSKSNPLSEKQNLSLADLKDENFIVVSETDHDISLKLILEECGRHGFVPKYKPSPSFYANIQWVRSGLAVAIVDSNSILSLESDIKLIRLEPFRNPSLVLAWYNQSTNPVREVFTDIVLSVAQADE